MIKQVIVMRKDLKMQRGKEIAQGAHASMSFLARRLTQVVRYDPQGGNLVDRSGTFMVNLSTEQEEWLHNGRFTKICVQVDSEGALDAIAQKAKDAGLEVHIIVDSGATVFHGVPTKTCLAIGPADADMIDRVTGHLPLY